MNYADQEEILRQYLYEIPSEMTAHAAVCEFDAEDDTPTLHIDLWREVETHFLPEPVRTLRVVAEGHWDGGRSISFQVAL